MISKQDFSEKEMGLLSSRLTFGKNSVPRRQSVTLTITPDKLTCSLTDSKLKQSSLPSMTHIWKTCHLLNRYRCQSSRTDTFLYESQSVKTTHANQQWPMNDNFAWVIRNNYFYRIHGRRLLQLRCQCAHHKGTQGVQRYRYTTEIVGRE